MNPRLAQLLVRLYPRPWRARYGVEFEALLETARGGLRASANVVWSALCERIFPTPGLKIEQRQFQSWCVRAPWAMFGLAPLFLLAGAWFVALLILWSGWKIFLPGADTPFVPIDDLREFFYFNVGRVLYFGAPILVGWGIGLIASRQRSKAFWPSVGLVLIALMGGTAQVHASRTAVPGGLGHISMDFILGHPVHGVPDGLLHALLILSITLLPWVIWRLQKALYLST
jgi:hypothetical protein